MRIAVDAFGSDNAPFPEIEGAIQAIKEDFCSEVILVGDETILNKELGKYFYDPQRIRVVHASERILMEDYGATAVRAKRDSSMVRAVELHQKGLADAALSAGNSGAMMAASLLAYGRIKGVLRPAIAVTFPTQANHEIILDVGANVDCEAEHLLQFAHLGSIYYQFFYKTASPRVSLLNIGEESAKGNNVSRGAYMLLQNAADINFTGNIEGKDVLKGVTDVIVCDGFVGNIVLKTLEGAVLSIFGILKEQFNKDWIAKFGAMLSYPVYKYLKRKLDHTEYGGALLVGLNGVSIVSHGRSNAKAIKNAIHFAARIAKTGFVQHTKEYFERLS
ncbi:MAG: phosphate acyltransferase PlsX [Candidatus Cloacimonadaceae bacterium]|nr:phosphate acyltransferase PlsX [Candidatus Cloacimonadaceae bacterium]MDP3113864.1 phosphate acyltransferase PlsX [Candidatus Cloacimonadaceae bacterium]